jgi:AP endonuclease 2
VAIYTRNETCSPIRSEEGITGVLTSPNSSIRFRDLPEEQQIGGYPRTDQLSGIADEATLDSEGRCVILEFPAFVLLGVYCPANRDETRDDFRIGFLEALDARIRNLVAMGKQLVLTGDLNIIRDELDTANLGERLQKADMSVEDFFSMPARKIFNQLVFDGRVVGERDEGREQAVLWDLCRLYHPTRTGMFTCWDTKKNTRPANNGSRIDYVLCTDGIKDWFCEANIQEGLMGSDHCPVYAVVKDRAEINGEERGTLDMMNPKGMFEDGRRVREWSAKDLLPSSAKLIPEFDRRRSIKEMFMKKTVPTPGPDTPTPTAMRTGETIAETEHPTMTGESQRAVSRKSTGTAPQGPKAPAEPPKRPAPSPKSSKAQKKPKTARAAGPGQVSLKAFFQAKPSASAASSSSTENPEIPASESRVLTTWNDADNNGGNTPQRTVADSESDTVFDPIANKDSWSKLMKKRSPPRCEHDEPCITLTTKKAGVNNGGLCVFFPATCPRMTNR